ncbi:hypothetical protein B0F90DRAFT_1691308 [Multifurca ochricompacta]|uniref:Uncharacterized protein n=1 Tax=Multifurca ochricompacta TaxID=376703 RepID=A0AAD4QP81_9AGAM|nr:hypothetical protein B0F90DRAFT_1691308 [Multifurca ochricompacta]
MLRRQATHRVQYSSSATNLTDRIANIVMCYNIVDGRFHQRCRHFKAMSTRRQDCMRHVCLFSCRHPFDCMSRRTCRCKRRMDLPILNPIRLSPTRCPDCRTVWG